jgi:hypothetical protein
MNRINGTLRSIRGVDLGTGQEDRSDLNWDITTGGDFPIID